MTGEQVKLLLKEAASGQRIAHGLSALTGMSALATIAYAAAFLSDRAERRKWQKRLEETLKIKGKPIEQAYIPNSQPIVTLDKVGNKKEGAITVSNNYLTDENIPNDLHMAGSSLASALFSLGLINPQQTPASSIPIPTAAEAVALLNRMNIPVGLPKMHRPIEQKPVKRGIPGRPPTAYRFSISPKPGVISHKTKKAMDKLSGEQVEELYKEAGLGQSISRGLGSAVRYLGKHPAAGSAALGALGGGGVGLLTGGDAKSMFMGSLLGGGAGYGAHRFLGFDPTRIWKGIGVRAQNMRNAHRRGLSSKQLKEMGLDTIDLDKIDLDTIDLDTINLDEILI